MALKTAKAGLVVWGPGFGSQLTTTGAGSCSIGAGSFNDVVVGAKLSGVVSCDSALVDPSLYPPNGKIKLSYAAKTLSTQAYIRIVGFDPVPGPDVIAVTGIVVKGGGVGATVSGEVGFDPVVKALANNEGGGPAEGPVLLRRQPDRERLWYSHRRCGWPHLRWRWRDVARQRRGCLSLDF